MAAGDLTLNALTPLRLHTGSIQVDNTLRAFAILPNVHSILMFIAQDRTGAGTAEVRLNQNAAGTTVNGTIAAVGNHTSTETYNFLCVYA